MFVTAMVHLRLNEREANPNPFINFIMPLPMGSSTTEEDARQLLRALAAQVKPIMKAHGFTVNSLEEVYRTIHTGPTCAHHLASTSITKYSWDVTGMPAKPLVSAELSQGRDRI